MTRRTALVTGATGYIGGLLVPALLEADWSVRVFTRSPEKLDATWRDSVEVVEGDAGSADDVAAAVEGVDVAYYLLHSMNAGGDFRSRDLELARSFATAARDAEVGRIVYLSGLHPSGELSEHLASRVEVGEEFLRSGVPTAVLQAGVVLGDGSVSFDMLRHLSERLPLAVGPKWLKNNIQPIAARDVIHYLVRAAELDPSVNRSIDVGMDERLTYLEMMRRYARVTGLLPRLVGTVPVLTPRLASLWVGLVTPVASAVARPLVDSLIHDAVKSEDDAATLLGDPEGGLLGFDEAVKEATGTVEPKRWSRMFLAVSAEVAACAVAGSVLTNPQSLRYKRLSKPSWQPPAAVFPVVWTALYSMIAVAATSTIVDLEESGQEEEAAAARSALRVNLLLNAGWSGLFFRSRNLPLATAGAAALAASSADLARRGAAAGPVKAAAFGVYAAWCSFATVLTGAIWKRNAGRRKTS